ncbi:MAG TPA: hypothetical protein PKK06_10505 [Phycisphaerae bacterium]|nr:hypothetical protein [Phycisphaerae bacterium]HNU45794.1 hypothetical protein [Phycisphaerae bacterium]
MAEAIQPIADDELLLRRIPANPEYFNPDVDPHPSPFAFRPRADDNTGLSLVRMKFASVREVAANPRGKHYYVAVLRAADLRDHGLSVVPRPLPDNPGHSEIPELTYANRSTSEAKEMQLLLAERLCVRIEGPFP